MTEIVSADTREGVHTRAVRLWLFAVAAMVAAMVLVGGASKEFAVLFVT